MSRVKNRLNELKDTLARMNYGGGGGAGMMFRLPRLSSRMKSVGVATGVAGATLGSATKPKTSSRSSDDPTSFALPVPKGLGRAVSVPKTATATKTATKTATIPAVPKTPKPEKPRKPRVSGSSGDSNKEEREDTNVEAPPKKSSIYSKVAQVLRRRK